MILARMAQSQMFALASKYGITQLFSCSINFVKNRVFSAFASIVLWVYDLNTFAVTKLFFYAMCYVYA